MSLMICAEGRVQREAEGEQQCKQLLSAIQESMTLSQPTLCEPEKPGPERNLGKSLHSAYLHGWTSVQ